MGDLDEIFKLLSVPQLYNFIDKYQVPPSKHTHIHLEVSAFIITISSKGKN